MKRRLTGSKLLVAGAVVAVLVVGMSGCAPPQPLETPGQDHDTVSYLAEYPSYSTIADLNERADLVVRGVVLSSELKEIEIVPQPIDEEDARLRPDLDQHVRSYVYTVYTMKVEDCYKGCATAGDTVEVKLSGGGTLGGVEYVSDDPKLQANQAYVLFLETYPELTEMPASLLNPTQAVFDSKADARGEYPGVHPDNDLRLSSAQLEELRVDG